MSYQHLELYNFHQIIQINKRGRVQTTWTNEGEGVSQMTTTLNNCYLIKVTTWGEEVKIAQNSVHVVCTRSLIGKSIFDIIRLFFHM